jgi:hypothetical protein
MVDPDWEKAYGHAHAALRYGVMSRPSASSELDAPGDWNPRSDALRAYEKRMYEGEYGRPVLIDV